MTENDAAAVRVTLLQVTSSESESKGARVQRVSRLLGEMPETDIALLPELWPVGYFQFERYAEEAEDLHGPTVEILRRAAIQRGMYLLGGSLIERDDEGLLYNTSILIDPTG